MKQVTYCIDGMHCASCELLIEQRILEEKGVTAADASIGNKTVTIIGKNWVPSVDQLNAWFKEDGYTFGRTPIRKKREPLLYVVEGKQGIQLDRRELSRRFHMLGRVAIVIAVLWLVSRLGLSQYVNLGNSSALGLFFVFGVVAGLSSCAALVGGVLLSMTKAWNEALPKEASLPVKLVPHLYFHGGRLFSYAVFGAILGGIGQIFSFDSAIFYAIVTMSVSLIMLLIGLQMAGVEWAERFQIRLPKSITRRISVSDHALHRHMPFAVGAGTILLPCGFTLAAEAIALSSGSAARGASMMILFVLGTAIPLFLIGLASIKGTEQPKRKRMFSFYAGVVLVLFALYNTNAQFNVLGWPSVSDVLARGNTESRAAVSKSPDSPKGTQILSITAKGFEYTLTSGASIQSGIPTTLLVDNQGMVGCGLYMASRGLIPGSVALTPGMNTIDLGKPKKGTYKISCTMGMVAPVVVRVI
ncbi:MAG: hypothetical protein COU35_04390 [Candidatus Magasanikbacteria bacterium CG10_big_fil_rev_8_21_14_0_10_47_10]|uniref:HMA domain-containing protein n=1 Tax=Candidatus Magasanikbacteria bacterium CG10_big_fil_rev_8_21_14_0_10_47_10 TaxID=1974652 RepID=A0A2H0TPG5_9BACT|nr:MAG: hypothetical protein COU35_04390 [Candidatus Magasanikbacteria bacterium CG10_big_fil_rev_8_21_14_0_10_47_10]